MDVERLKDYYLCKDLDHRNLPVLYDELLKRSRSLVIDGVSFPLPRRLKEQIFYTREKDLKTGFYRLRKISLYAMALEFARSRNNQSFAEQLPKHSEAVSYSADRLVLSKLSDREQVVLDSREERAQAVLSRQHSKDNR